VALARIKANSSSQDWASLYQQEPTADTGSYFKEGWIKPIYRCAAARNAQRL
jgi:hypothetical protein